MYWLSLLRPLIICWQPHHTQNLKTIALSVLVWQFVIPCNITELFQMLYSMRFSHFHNIEQNYETALSFGRRDFILSDLNPNLLFICLKYRLKRHWLLLGLTLTHL